MDVINKAVIPAAGLGTRFLPASRVIPKELLPMFDVPLIHKAVEECVNVGIKEFIFIISNDKDSIIQYFENSLDFEKLLRNKNLNEHASYFSKLRNEVSFRFVYQPVQLGLGHAVLMAKDHIGSQAFAVVLPDDVILGEQFALGELINIYNLFQTSVLAVEKISNYKISNYGVIKPFEIQPFIYEVKDMVEKPAIELAPSNLGIVGRYILTPEIFQVLETVKPGFNGEIQLTDALLSLLEVQKILACEFSSIRFDAGNPIGLLKASLYYALSNEVVNQEMRKWLTEILKNET
jgi:UTP--glucose-1-phosphate uridylyltransferase